MPQGEGGGASREQHQRAQLVLSAAAAELPPNPAVLNSLTENARGRTLAYEDLSRCFHLPINAAAKELGVCVTALKKQCRKHGVQRWPHRKLKSLDKLKEKLEKEEATAADKEYYKHEIHSIAQKKDHIFRSSAASVAAAPNTSTDPGVSNLGGSAPPSSARPPHQLVMGRPVAQFHQGAAVAAKGAGATLPPHYAAAQGRNPTLVPFAADPEKPQMVPAPLVMPFPHIPGAPPGTIPGPNGALIPQPGQPYPLCGIYGCDCYMNNGVSSRMYHPPIQAPRVANSVNVANNAIGSPNLRNNGAAVNSVPAIASGMPNVHYFNSSAYAYGPAVAHMGPYQNMVQVNVMEQPSFPHGARPAQGAAVPGPNNATSQSQPMTHQSGSGPPMSSASGFEVYGNLPHGANGAGSAFVYNPFVTPNVHYSGVMDHQGNASAVPGYWTDMQQHQQNTPGNLVTMCNQTVHHHHHHAMDTAGTASPVVTERRQSADNTSSKTNNSGACAQALSEAAAKEKETGSNPQASTTGGVNADIRTANQKNSTKKARSCQETQKCGKEGRNPQKSAEELPNLKDNAPAQALERNRASKIVPQSQSEPKAANKQLRLPNGTQHAPMPNGVRGTSTEQSSETSDFSRRSNDKNSVKESQSRKWNNKRPRVQALSGMHAANVPSPRKDGNAPPASVNEEVSGPVVQSAGSPEAKGNRKDSEVHDLHSSRNGGKPSDPKKARLDQARRPESPRKRDTRGSGTGASSPGTPNSATTGPDFAKRYDHVVHQCLGLQTAQWCTDLNFKVSLALGPKALLGLAGVPSLGRSVLDGTDSALEDAAATRTKYSLSARGQRLEWIATKGNSKYLVVMNPYRKRNSQEISGVSGLIVELRIVRALPK